MVERVDLPLRVVVEGPVPGFVMALQRGASGKAQFVPPVGGSEAALVFAFEIVVDGTLADGRPRLLGPCVQGPPNERFVYLCIGKGAAWTRRAKIPLGAISWAQIEGLKPGERLIARYSGRARDGTPACATVRLLEPGWIAG
jgi:hypothetical protein